MSLILLSAASVPAYAAQTSCNNNGGAGWPINDGDQTTISIDYNIADIGFITDLDVDVDISHTYTGDLTARIISPQGTAVTLFERPGTATGFNVNGGPFGCAGNDINVLFDDESAGAPLENAACGNNPAYSGSHRPHNNAPNNLSAIDGENPAGAWSFFFMDPVNQDTGTMNEACIVVSSVSVTFDQWVSTNATCSDQLDTLSVLTGSNLYVCYTLRNSGDESLVLNGGNWNDSLGNDLSGFVGTYAAGASQTLNFGPFAAGGAKFPIGSSSATSDVTMTGNSANFPAPNTLFTDESVQVSVGNTPPSSGNKQLYLYSNSTMSRTAPATNQAELTIAKGNNQTWTLTPALQAPLTLNTTGGQIPVTLYLRESGGGAARNFTLTLSGSTSGTIGSLATAITLTGTSTAYTVNVPISGATSLVSGETISLNLDNTTGGGGARNILLDPSGAATNFSLVTLPSNTVINVDSVRAYAVSYATNPAASPITTIQPGQTVYIRSQVSDPFGSFDISSATIDVTDPTPTLLQNDAAMTQVFDSTTNTKIYEYSYNVNPFAVQGAWRFEVTANEGTEGVRDSEYLDFSVVSPPSVTVVKSSNVVGGANPGTPVTYQIVVSNTGAGPATNIQLTDVLSRFVTLNQASFSCSTGCPASGVTLGTPSFTANPSGKVIQWDLLMGGSLSSGGGSFTLQYQATVD
ncbi:MAG: proprotein convertase P-domain-containing protein [Alcanivoracaceae bacterium]|nr:proprotein convertase P-domain-containing protein [Alcanivoracaceae bacterium]